MKTTYYIQQITEKSGTETTHHSLRNASRMAAEDLVATLTFRAITSNGTKDPFGWTLTFYMEDGTRITVRIESEK